MHGIVLSALLSLAGADATAAATVDTVVADDPCRDALDATVDEARRCRSPGALDPALVAQADAIPAKEAPARDPLLFPSELGFMAVTSAVVGGGAVVGALFTASQETDATCAVLRQGTFWGGVSLLSLAGGLAAAGLSTWVFDVSTGTLRLPIFEGEPK